MQSDENETKNLFVIASAGSGKTTYLVDEALKSVDKNVLITTYTEANENEIRDRIINKNRSLPKNVFVQTWFSMLLQHGVRPYQGYFSEKDINGMILAQGQSTRGIKESDLKHYFTKDMKLYSDKVSKFVIKCDKESKGKVISRLARIYGSIFIDEAQDMAGYDLDLIRLLCASNVRIVLVGDPRQGTFSTNNSAKNKQYRRYELLQYFNDKPIENLEIKNELLTTNHRSIQGICDLADKLFPEFNKTKSGNTSIGEHHGIFLVKKVDIERYLSEYSPVILRDSRKTSVSSNASVMNFGAAKGLTFDRVLIYPTQPIINWLKDSDGELAPISRSKLYVAITRAKYSVAFVYDYKDGESIVGCTKFAESRSS